MFYSPACYKDMIKCFLAFQHNPMDVFVADFERTNFEDKAYDTRERNNGLRGVGYAARLLADFLDFRTLF
jgi:hypothetical protein